MNKEHRNVRIKSGKRKGKFIKLKNLIAQENRLAAMKLSKEKKSQNDDNVIDSLPKSIESRRIILLKQLADELWCNYCNLPLSLRHCVNEKRRGLASIFTIQCKNCSIYHFVHTDTPKDKYHAFEVNSKLSFGMIDAGLGVTEVNTLLSSLDIPVISCNTIKRYERKVGPIIESVAKESCIQSLHLEKSLEKNSSQEELLRSESTTVCNEENSTINKEDVTEKNSKVFIKASYDSGWQRRGTGHSYNSLSGHGTVIGINSKKVLSYAVRSKDCRLCKIGHNKVDHDCRKNFQGSAKAMESDMAIELFTNNPIFDKENVAVNVLVGDNDSCAIASVRRKCDHGIDKWSDFNHTHKSFTSSLYNLKLPKNLIEYFSKIFAIAIKKNKGDVVKIELALQSVVPHAFGEHTLCGDRCKKNSNSEHKYNNLPNGKALNDVELRSKLTQLFSRYIKNVKCIAECASTQANESLNNVIASKNPKSKHYAASESLNYRVGASICQYNIGAKYCSLVYSNMGYTSSNETLKYRARIDEIREKRGLQIQTIEKKKRRCQLKKLRSLENTSLDRKEGITYESGIALNDLEFISNVDEIRAAVEVDDINFNDCEIIIYDLETSGLSKSDEILQISACAFSNDSSFNSYIIPSRSISKDASEKTGLCTIDGDLYLHENRVEAVPARVAIFQFLTYLKGFGCSILLLAHNGFRFDNSRIMSLIFKVGRYNEFISIVKGFSDSLPIFKTALTDRKKNKKKFSISALVEDYLPNIHIEDLHNGIADVAALKKLIITIDISHKDIIKNAKTIISIRNEENKKAIVLKNKYTFVDLKDKLSANIINKLSRTGITKQIMQAAFDKSGYEGLRHLLSENINNKPRVTKNKKLLQKIFDIFKKHIDYSINIIYYVTM